MTNSGTRNRKTVIDESLLPAPALIPFEERRSLTRLAYFEAWAWFQALVYWIPGRFGWLLRRVLYRPFFQRAGKRFHVAEFCSVQPPNRFQIGYRSALSRHVIINAQGGVILGDYSGIGPFSQVITVNHLFRNIDEAWGEQPRLLEAAPVIIRENVWVGGSTVILQGVEIGPNAIVAAGSVVTQDVPPNTMVAGVPAKVVRQLDEVPEGEFIVGELARKVPAHKAADVAIQGVEDGRWVDE
ncbi:MAG: acyltransferase [Anaerolineales bacterium]